MLNYFSNVVRRAKALQQNMTTVDFAHKLGMTQQTVDLYLRGARKPSLEFIIRLSTAFGCSADWIIGLATTNAEGERRALSSRIHELKDDAEQATRAIQKLQTALKNLDADLC